MVKDFVAICGSHLIDQHTHYDAVIQFGSYSATILIRGDISKQFQEIYGIPITSVGQLEARVDLVPDASLDSKNLMGFCSSAHVIGAITSIDDIVYLKKPIL